MNVPVGGGGVSATLAKNEKCFLAALLGALVLLPGCGGKSGKGGGSDDTDASMGGGSGDSSGDTDAAMGGGSGAGESCSSGTWDDDADSSTECIAWTTCPVGTYVENHPSATEDRVCAPCKKGTLSREENSGRCTTVEECPAGSYEVEPDSSSSELSCKSCPEGNYCPGGNSSPVECSEETWDGGSGASECQDWTQCKSDEFEKSAGSASSDRICEAVTSCKDTEYETKAPTATSDRLCAPLAPCTSGQKQIAAPTATSDYQCELCTEGEVCDGSTEVRVCSQGEYCPDGKVYETCTAGEYCDGGAGRTDCASVDGFSTDASGATPCIGWTPCGPGEAETAEPSRTEDRQCTAQPWTVQFGGDSEAWGVVADSSGNVIVVGDTSEVLEEPGNLNGDVFVRKLDAGGQEVWTRQFGTEEAETVWMATMDASDNVYLVGQTAGVLTGDSSGGGYDAYVRKYNSSGEVQWTDQFGGVSDESGQGAVVDENGDLFVTGTIDGAGANEPTAFLRKYSSSGTLLWGQDFGGAEPENPTGLAVHGSVLYMSGGTNYDLEGGSGLLGKKDCYLRKYDLDGNAIWTKQVGGDDRENECLVATDGAGSIYVAGTTDGNLGEPDVVGSDDDAFLRKFDSDGNVLWTRIFGSDDHDYAFWLTVDPTGVAYVGGYATGAWATSLGGEDAFIVRYASDGTPLWTERFGSDLNDGVTALWLGPNGHLYSAGYAYGDLGGAAENGGTAFVRRMVDGEQD